MNNQSVSSYPLDKIEYKSTGSGDPPILLLHGWGGDINSLDVIGTPLAQHRRVISISLPGFGKSPEPDAAWNPWDYLSMLKGWLELQGLSKVDIIAHSFGGRISIPLASRHPDLVGKLILISGAGLKSQRSMKTRLKIMTSKNIARVARVFRGRYAKFIENFRQQLGSQDWKLASPVMRGTLVKTLEEDLRDELNKIAAPTLLVWGEKDTATPLFMARIMDNLIQNSKLVVIPDAGHYCFLERKGEVLSAVWEHFGLPEAW
ncbi:MAG: alpha/beta hydrolase [Candidatus Hatepunaea meridiana]|nr:alpha/beta hydrolase [Candidatus Hatepunaea meridiana]